MSFTNDEKTNLLVKKFFGKPSSVNDKAYYLEPSIDARQRVFGQEHIQSQDVPVTRPAELASPTLDDSGNELVGSQAGRTSGVVRKYVKIELEEVPGAGGRAQRAKDDATQGRVFRDVIPFNRDTGGTFAYEVYRNDGVTAIPPGTTGGDYVVDTDAGVLTFQEQENVSSVVSAVAPPRITFQRYVGGVGLNDAIERGIADLSAYVYTISGGGGGGDVGDAEFQNLSGQVWDLSAYVQNLSGVGDGGGAGIDTSGASAGDVLVVDACGNIVFRTPGEANVILAGDVEQIITEDKIFNIGAVHITNSLTVSGKIVAGGGFQLPSGGEIDYVLVSDAEGNASWKMLGDVSGSGTDLIFDTSGAVAGDVLIVDGSGNITQATPGVANVVLTGDVEQIVTDNKIFNFGPVHNNNSVTVSGTLDVEGHIFMRTGATDGYFLTSDGQGKGTWRPLLSILDVSGANEGDILVIDGSGNLTMVPPAVANVVLTGDVEQIVTDNKIFNFGPVHNNNSVTVSGTLDVEGNIFMRTGARSGQILTSDANGKGVWQPLLSGDVGEAFVAASISNGLYVSGAIPDAIMRALSLSGGADFSGNPVDYVLSLQGDNKPAAWRKIQEASGLIDICGMVSADSITVNGDINVIGGSVITQSQASDMRIKEDIHPLETEDYAEAVDRFMATPMYRQRYRPGWGKRGGFDEERTYRGFLAQDFERSQPGSTNWMTEGLSEEDDLSGVMLLNMDKEFTSREVPVMLRFLLEQNMAMRGKLNVLERVLAERRGCDGGREEYISPLWEDVPMRCGQSL